MKIFGFIPARMAASRFPGKPLKKILNIPMIKHVYLRSKYYKKWENLFITGCDREIQNFCKKENIPYIDTSKKHVRCLDRIYEAASKINISDKDLIVCVQGDEPMLRPEMITNCIKPIAINKKIKATVLAMDIINKDQYVNPNTVKIIHDQKDEVLYTSRSPVPYCKKFHKNLGAKRIYGIFSFKWSFLKKFYYTKPSYLEKVESCDSNRICDTFKGQFIARQRYIDSFSVDCPSDLKKVEKYLKKDFFYNRYKNK